VKVELKWDDMIESKQREEEEEETEKSTEITNSTNERINMTNIQFYQSKHTFTYLCALCRTDTK
jgi:hypothetical protein